MIVLAPDEHRIGFSVVMTQGMFNRLLKLAPTKDMEGWSEAITKLIERS